jgi:poly(3-hydroxybutyrate) depolymerase
VPRRYAGAGRQVYPGFVQLLAFMSMNVERHVKAHRELFDNLVKGELAKAQATKDFYDEYFAVLDLTAEFYLELSAPFREVTFCAS